MALQVWLPLNGDLRNIGLDLETPALTSHAVAWQAGKLGKCLYTNAVQSASGHFKSLEYLEKWSFALWIKISTDAPTSWADIFTLGANNDGNTGNVRIEHTNVVGNCQIICNKSGTSGSDANTYYGIGPLVHNASDKWAHLAVTNNKETITTYLNGSVFRTYSVSNIYPVGALTGDVILGATGAKGWLNDIRIYDHVLSQTEVKELSKGLMVHYPMSEGGYEGINNILPTPIANGNISREWDTTLHTKAIQAKKWSSGFNGGVTNSSTGYHAHWQEIDGIPCMVFPRLNYSISGLAADRWLGISEDGQNHAAQIGSSTTYTLSFEAMADSPGRTIFAGYYYSVDGTSNHFHDGYCYANDIPVGKWKRYSFTFTTQPNVSTSPSAYFYFYGSRGANGTAYVRNPQVEVGAVCHDYYPGTKPKDTIMYDTSGFGYDGVITGTIKSEQTNVNTSADSSRNYENKSYSAKFDGSSYICYDTEMPIPDSYTMSFWLKKASDGHVVDWRSRSNESGLQPVYFGGGKIQYYSSLGSGIYFDYVFSNNVWYHITLAVDATTVSLYVNGVKQQTINMTNTPGNNGALHIGCRVSYANVPIMNMKDFRIYATKLNDDDIKKLVDRAAFIDGAKNLYVREFREGSGA